MDYFLLGLYGELGESDKIMIYVIIAKMFIKTFEQTANICPDLT